MLSSMMRYVSCQADRRLSCLYSFPIVLDRICVSRFQQNRESAIVNTRSTQYLDKFDGLHGTDTPFHS